MRISDWSSDVCSSDLAPDDFVGTFNTDRFCNSVCKSGYLRHDGNDDGVPAFSIVNPTGSRTALPEPRGLSAARIGRSEERRVGKECVSTCRSRWSPYHEKKKKKQNI